MTASTDISVPVSVSLTSTVFQNTSAGKQLRKFAHITTKTKAQDTIAGMPRLVHSGDTTDEADDEDNGGCEQDVNHGNEHEEGEEERVVDSADSNEDLDEHIKNHTDDSQAATTTTTGDSVANAIIVVDDDTEPDTESEPELGAPTTIDIHNSSPTSKKRKAPAPSTHPLFQQSGRPSRRCRLFAPPAATSHPASQAWRTSPPPPMSPTRSANAFSDVLRSSRKLRTVQQLENNPDVVPALAALSSFANATATAHIMATKPVEPLCAPETCPMLLSLGLNPSGTTQAPTMVYDPLSRAHIPFPSAARLHGAASQKHKHDRHAVHQAVHMWQRQKSRLNTLAGLADDDWVKGEIKACVLQMGAVVGEAWRELWYREDGSAGQDERAEVRQCDGEKIRRTFVI